MSGAPPQALETQPGPVDGHLTYTQRLLHWLQPDVNGKRRSCASVPTASRAPKVPIKVCLVGGETYLGSHLIRGLTNPAYAPAFSAFHLDVQTLLSCSDAQQVAARLQGVHTVVLSVELNEDAVWQRTLEGCKVAGVKRFIPAPVSIHVQQVAKSYGKNPFPPLLHRYAQRQKDLIGQKELHYTFLEVGVLTEQLFTPLYGVDVSGGREGGVVRAPDGHWNRKVATTTANDLARFLPEVLLSKMSDKTTVQLATAVISYKRIAEILDDALGRPVKREVQPVPAEDAGNDLTDDQRKARLWMRVAGREGMGALRYKGDSWNAQRCPHVAATTLKRWVAQHIAAGGEVQQSAPAPQAEPNLHPTLTGLAPLVPPAERLYFRSELVGFS